MLTINNTNLRYKTLSRYKRDYEIGVVIWLTINDLYHSLTEGKKGCQNRLHDDKVYIQRLTIATLFTYCKAFPWLSHGSKRWSEQIKKSISEKV